MTTDGRDASKHILLICSVGGTPEPLVESLRHWRPDRVCFVPSEQTRKTVDSALSAFARTGPHSLNPGQYDFKIVPDPEDLVSSVCEIRELESEVVQWVARGDDYHVLVDFTGGTKCVTAALVLVSRRWPCRYSYVGGARRTKGGVGVVETGAEHVVISANPWNALGYQAVEEAVVVFDRGAYASASALLETAMKNTDAPNVKRELATLKSVIDAYAAWDRFDHELAGNQLKAALKNRNDLSRIFPRESAALCTCFEKHLDHLIRLEADAEPSAAWVADLLANARRRAGERRHDDAVARLYRAIEALAQVRLRQAHGIPDTSAVPASKLPDTLVLRWGLRPDDHHKLALANAYELLEALDDDLGKRFAASGLAGKKSPLSARNRSILAHGFKKVSRGDYAALWSAALNLAGISDSELITFPRLAAAEG